LAAGWAHTVPASADVIRRRSHHPRLHQKPGSRVAHNPPAAVSAGGLSLGVGPDRRKAKSPQAECGGSLLGFCGIKGGDPQAHDLPRRCKAQTNVYPQGFRGYQYSKASVSTFFPGPDGGGSEGGEPPLSRVASPHQPAGRTRAGLSASRRTIWGELVERGCVICVILNSLVQRSVAPVLYRPMLGGWVENTASLVCRYVYRLAV
jgi:hypothetical protein